jgi:relaxase-like protein
MSKGGTFCRFYKGGTGRSSAHMNYISRGTAVRDGEDGVLTRNIPEYVTEAEDYRELRSNLTAYAEVREEFEQMQHRSKGECRTHFRTVLSFEHDVETEKAKEMTNEWLEKRFPNARAAAFVHRDTDHTHVHVWIDARQVDNKKIDIPPKTYRRLDEDWNRIYSREFGKDEREHTDKKAETLAHREARSRGESQRQEPRRAKRVLKRDDFDSRERGNYGVDKSAGGANQRAVARGQRAINSRKREIEELHKTRAGVSKAAKNALRTIGTVRETVHHRETDRIGR